MAFEVGSQAGEAKGQVELIGRSLAQACDADRLRPSGADRSQNGLIVVIIVNFQAVEGTERELSEQTRSAIQDRTLAALTVALDGLMQHHGGQSKPSVFLDVDRQAGLQLLGLLGGLGGAGRSVHLPEHLLLAAQYLVQLPTIGIELGNLVCQRLKLIGQSIQIERQGRLAERIERFACTELLDLLVEDLESISELKRVS